LQDASINCGRGCIDYERRWPKSLTAPCSVDCELLDRDADGAQAQAAALRAQGGQA
jgi:hypothetical protein